MSNEYDPSTASQPLPTVNNEECVQDKVIQDILARKAHGIKKYGTILQPNNGRDALVDAYEESLDQTQYLKQLIIERDRKLTQNGIFLAKLQSGELKDG